MAKIVKDLYDKYTTAKSWYDTGILKEQNWLEDQVFHKWNDCFKDFKGKQSNNNTAQICNFNTVQYSDYIHNLNRNLICIDDARSVYTNKHKFIIIYTDHNTYLTKDPTYVPVEVEESTNLFEGL